mgnify:CR=1 FL=1
MIRLSDLLKEVNSNTPVYNFNFIETIAVWQNFGIQDKSNLKKLLNLNIPQKFKAVNFPIYRVISIDEYTDLFPGIGSWTLDINIAKEFANTLWYLENQKSKTILLQIDNPKQENVILNIDYIFKDQDFVNSIAYHESLASKKKGKWFNEGLGIEDLQREVIYNANELSRKNIIAELINGKWKKISQ